MTEDNRITDADAIDYINDVLLDQQFALMHEYAEDLNDVEYGDDQALQRVLDLAKKQIQQLTVEKKLKQYIAEKKEALETAKRVYNSDMDTLRHLANTDLTHKNNTGQNESVSYSSHANDVDKVTENFKHTAQYISQLYRQIEELENILSDTTD